MLATGPLIIIVIRLLVPFTILRWPLAGGILAWFFDTFDVVIMEILGMGWFDNYRAADKILDTYYLAFMAFVSLKWIKIARNTSIALFAYRFLGVLIFEITKIRWLLFIFPNLFENFYFFWVLRNKYFPQFELTKQKLIMVLGLLLIPKLVQEYILHVAALQPWTWIKTNLLQNLGLFK